jgi:hypothetical protein
MLAKLAETLSSSEGFFFSGCGDSFGFLALLLLVDD